MSRHVEKLASVHTKCQYQVTVLGTDPVLEIGTILLHLNGRNFLIPYPRELIHGIKPLRLNGSFDSKCTRPETSHSYQSFTILINTSTGIIVDLDNLRFKWHNNSRHQTVK